MEETIQAHFDSDPITGSRCLLYRVGSGLRNFSPLQYTIGDIMIDGMRIDYRKALQHSYRQVDPLLRAAQGN